jgi:hypothetical protein
MNCPKCGGEMYDNRPKKRSGEYNPKAPDFKCKDKQCLDAETGFVTAVWEHPQKGAPQRKAAPAPPVEIPEFLREHEQEVQKDVRSIARGSDLAQQEQEVHDLYVRITNRVLRDLAPLFEQSKVGASPESIQAAVATEFLAIRDEMKRRDFAHKPTRVA